MKFKSDSQRKAVFANMFNNGISSNSKVSSSNVKNFESKSSKKRVRKGLKTYGKAQGMRIGMQTLSQATPPPTSFSYAPLSESRRRKRKNTIVVPDHFCGYCEKSGLHPRKKPCTECGRVNTDDEITRAKKKEPTERSRKLLDLERRKLETLTMENKLKKKLDMLEKKGEELVIKHQDDEIGYLEVAKNTRLEHETRSQWLMAKRVRQELVDEINKMKHG